MNRHDLSDFVIQLTDSATRLGPLDFNRDLIRLVRSIARFDSAWWGWSVIRERHLSFVHSQTLNLAPGFVDSAKAQLETDPFMHRARRLRHFAQALSAKEVESNSPAAAVMHDYGIAQALAGHCRVGDGPFNFFMSLYRSSPEPRFTAEETGDVRILLRHAQQALALSLRLTLGSQVDRGEEWALADAGGELFLHSPGFPSLHRRSGRAELQRLPLDLPVTRAGSRVPVTALFRRPRPGAGRLRAGPARADRAGTGGLPALPRRSQPARGGRGAGAQREHGQKPDCRHLPKDRVP